MTGAPLLLALAVSVRALDTLDIPSVPGKSAATENDRRAEKAEERLKSDAGAARILADRILRSSLADKLADQARPEDARSGVLSWIKSHPKDAARLASGFAQDDARGDDAFERSLYERITRRFELSPDRYRGLLGRLNYTAEASKRISGFKHMDDDESRRLLKGFFEGESNVGDRRAGKSAPKSGGPPEVSGDSLYDRIGRENPTGYSPHVQAYQSEVNRRRAPGAPALIETGRLDFATLRYPYYGLQYDIDRLGKSLAEHAEWEKKPGNGDLGLKRRADALARAKKALEDFNEEAERTKNRSGITTERLKRLAKLRRDAARWIAYASQTERLTRLKLLAGFLDDELRRAVAAAPVDMKDKTGFLNFGNALSDDIAASARRGEAAAALLSPQAGEPPSPDWMRAEEGFIKTRADLARLSRVVSDYRSAGLGVSSVAAAPEGVKSTLQNLAARWMPNSEVGQKSAAAKKKRTQVLAAFLRFARTKP